MFLSLGLAGLTMISLAVNETVKFMAGSDRIAAALSTRPAAAVQNTAIADTKAGPTNIATIEKQRVPNPSRSPSKV